MPEPLEKREVRVPEHRVLWKTGRLKRPHSHAVPERVKERLPLYDHWVASSRRHDPILHILGALAHLNAPRGEVKSADALSASLRADDPVDPPIEGLQTDGG